VSTTPTDPNALSEEARRAAQSFAPTSYEHYEKARKLIPHGATRNRFWWPIPLYIDHAQGAYAYDMDGREYIDCLLGFGPMILGHGHPEVRAAIDRQVARGTQYGAPPPEELGLAEQIVGAVPNAGWVVFLTSGTEATMSALRIARAATGRTKVAKFEGGWHGWHDFLLQSFYATHGDVERPLTVPDSLGIPAEIAADVVTRPFNHPAAFARIREEASDLACVIVEGLQGSAGALVGTQEFMSELRDVCTEHGILLILDEVITGFRLAPGGSAAAYGIKPDLTTLGKAIGGGMPVAAVVGSPELFGLMHSGADAGGSHESTGASGAKEVVLGGTFSANPLGMAAGQAQLAVLLRDGESYRILDALGARMRDGLERVIADAGIDAHVTGAGSIWGTNFTATAPDSRRAQKGANKAVANVASSYLLAEGVLVSAPLHLGFVSTAHTEADVDAVVEAHGRAFRAMKREGLFG
jgi:glutamate-1-semialdehyde 2,1-aminomutase